MKRLDKYSVLDDDGVIHTDYGAEFCEPTPIEVPLRWKRPPTLEERIRLFMRSEAWRQEMARSGRETFEEADDFEVEADVDDPLSGYETIELESELLSPVSSPVDKGEPAPAAESPAKGAKPAEPEKPSAQP